jgi:hypothetical protein
MIEGQMENAGIASCMGALRKLFYAQSINQASIDGIYQGLVQEGPIGDLIDGLFITRRAGEVKILTPGLAHVIGVINRDRAMVGVCFSVFCSEPDEDPQLNALMAFGDHVAPFRFSAEDCVKYGFLLTAEGQIPELY